MKNKVYKTVKNKIKIEKSKKMKKIKKRWWKDKKIKIKIKKTKIWSYLGITSLKKVSLVAVIDTKFPFSSYTNE